MDVTWAACHLNGPPTRLHVCVYAVMTLCVGVSMLDAVFNYANVEQNTAYACFSFFLPDCLPEHWAI